uniref:Uncharacterized protein n=1 Tax=Anguilla anguilla TaxID=7936 RepID=A0A0E9SCJ6_ANGAN
MHAFVGRTAQETDCIPAQP